MGQRARLIAEEHFDRRVVVRQLEDQFESAARRLPDRRKVSESMAAPTLRPVDPNKSKTAYPGVSRKRDEQTTLDNLKIEFESDSSSEASIDDSTVGSSY